MVSAGMCERDTTHLVIVDDGAVGDKLVECERDFDGCDGRRVPQRGLVSRGGVKRRDVESASMRTP